MNGIYYHNFFYFFLKNKNHNKFLIKIQSYYQYVDNQFFFLIIDQFVDDGIFFFMIMFVSEKL